MYMQLRTAHKPSKGKDICQAAQLTDKKNKIRQPEVIIGPIELYAVFEGRESVRRINIAVSEPPGLRESKTARRLGCPCGYTFAAKLV